jgi:hypothetical protein
VRWTAEVKVRFLHLLSGHGNVRVAAAAVGLSRQGAYLARRRDAVFARAWDAALVLARGHAEGVLAERALDGVVEDVWFRGELVGSRRRYDARLLLAHLARLDRQAEALDDDDASEGAFDRLLGEVAGLAVADEVTEMGEDRDAFLDAVAEQAARDYAATAYPFTGRARDADYDEAAEIAAENAAIQGAEIAAGKRWDAARAALYAAVDDAVAGQAPYEVKSLGRAGGGRRIPALAGMAGTGSPFSPRTVSNESSGGPGRTGAPPTSCRAACGAR